MKQFRLGAPWFTVASFLLVGLLVTVTASWRWGGALMSFGLFVGAAMRSFFPSTYVSDIAVRSRATDIGLYLMAGVAVLAAVLLLLLN